MPDPASLDWVLVCGGFHGRGGMDRANAALAEYLSETGARVHLVAHDVEESLVARSGIVPHLTVRLGGTVLGGELALAQQCARVAGTLKRDGRRVLVLANGGNVLHGDVNWVHSLHHAWRAADAGAPAWFKAKNRGARWWYRRRERIAIRSAGTVITNSGRTRRDVMTHLGVSGERAHTVYIGSAPDWRVPSAGERARARARWCRDSRRHLVAFVGALGHDANKGIDTLLASWARLRTGGPWDADLVVAGPGHSGRWERMAGGADVRFVGFTNQIGELLDAADLLVSPVRYEAYGLAVHEAICRGVPVLTSRHAGIVERFQGAVDDLLLQRPGDVEELTHLLLAWRASPAAWRDRFEDVRHELSAHTLRNMAARITDIVTAAVAEGVTS